MPGERSFGSFQELARHARAEEWKQGRRRDAGPTRETNHELFREVLEGHFHQVPPGEFFISHDGIESFSIGHIGGKVSSGPDAADQLFATFFYRNSNDRQASFTWSIGQDGTFSGALPPNMKIARSELVRTVLETMKKVGVGFWHMQPDIFLGQADPGARGDREETGNMEDSEQEELEAEIPISVDPERLEFLREQPGALTGWLSEDLGFYGYHAVVFPDRIVLEHPQYGNAAFVIDLSQNILTDPRLESRNIQSQLTADESNYFYEKYWAPIITEAKTKKQLRALGARKVVHRGDSKWRERLAVAIQAPRLISTAQ